MDDLLSIDQTAKMLHVSPRTLLNYRRKAHGPAPTRVGPRRIFYQRSEVTAYLAAMRDMAIDECIRDAAGVQGGSDPEIRRTCVVRLPLSERLRQCRAFAGLTQKALAERTGIPEHKISSLESGRTRGYLDEIRAILMLTGCGDQEQDVFQCWDMWRRTPVPKTDKQKSVIEYDDAIEGNSQCYRN